MYSSSIYLYILLVQWITTGLNGDENMPEEPTCYSRFDYDHKMMTSLVTLETKIGQLENTIKQQQEIITHLETQVNDGLSTVGQDIGSLSDKILAIESVISLDGSSATYIRWGRTVCPGNGTELVYEGYAGGSHQTHTGAVAEYICLPKDPIWSQFNDGVPNYGAYIHGSEYEFGDGLDQELFGRNLDDQDVPCAVCKTKRASVMMIPARDQCYDGWALEYHGYLSGGHHGHPAASELVCLDSEPEIIAGGAADRNGKLFYPAVSVCGSLNCPPYVNGRELTCSVCSL